MSAHGNLFYNQIRNGGAQIKTGNYTIIESDAWSDIVANSAGAITITLPATPPSSVFKVYIENIGAGTCTISRNGHNIDGAASDLTLITGQGVVIFTDGTNWFTAGQPAASSILLQTNSVNNASQTKLNLIAGTNMAITDGGGGNITLASSGGGGGSGIGALTQISQQVLAAQANSVTFSSIPQIYDTLILVIKARVTDAVANIGGTMEFNSDAGANYSREYFGVGNGSANNGQNVGVVPGTAAAFLATGASAGANDAAVNIITIPRYAETTFNKAGITNVTCYGSGINNQGYQISWTWNNTAAITSITLIDGNGGNFLVGSSFTLYGMGGSGAAFPSGFQFFDGVSYWMQHPAFKCTPPIASNFSWVNQGTSTETASGGQLYLHGPDLDNTGQHIRVASMAGKTTLIANIVPLSWGYPGTGSNNANCHVVFRESATGKLVEIAFGFDNAQPLVIVVWALASPTVFTAEMAKTVVGRTFPYITVKLQLTGGNIVFSYSFDGGTNFTQLWSEAQTVHFTTGPDQWGYGVEPHSAFSSVALTHFATS